MAASIHDHLTDQLFKVILSLKDQEQCYKFFEDIRSEEHTSELQSPQ